MFLGFALATLFNSDQFLLLTIFALVFAFLIEVISQNKFFEKSTIIATISYACIAAAIILRDTFNLSNNLGDYVFGNILTVNTHDIIALSLLSLIVVIYSLFAFRKILLISINSDLARIAHLKINFWNISFTALLALAIALSTHIVGIFLMTALLILPAAAARIISSSPRQMICFSVMIGTIFVVISFAIANQFNLNFSATLVATLFALFAISLIIKTKICHV